MDDEFQQMLRMFFRDPPVFAVANKRGKFPMAKLEKTEDGSSFDTVPLTHACTQRDFDKIRALVAALHKRLNPAETEE